MTPPIRVTVAIIAALHTGTPALAQVADAQTFNAVSIRRNTTNDPRQDFGGAPGRLVGMNIPLWWLIRSAYQIQESELIGAPPWVFSERYDIVATVPAGSSPAQTSAMLITMMADRFRLIARRESREVPIFALVVARADGRLGPTLRQAPAVDCAAVRLTTQRCGLNVQSGRVVARAAQLAELAPLLSQFVGRRVFDRTGLSGRFDFELEWGSGLAADANTTQGAPIVTALQEQLGLKLESQRAPVDVIVVERVERPTEN